MRCHAKGTIAALLPFGALLVVGWGCACPKGNVVVASRDVGFVFQLSTPAEIYMGQGTSPPSGDGIEFDRATLPVMDPDKPAASATDLVLHALAPGCHPDTTGAVVCDWSFDVFATIHGVNPHAGLPLTIDLDDSSASVKVAGSPPPVLGPCPDKPGLADAGVKCAVPSDAGPAAFVTYEGLQGQMTLTELAENCTNVLSICALTAQGTFQLTGVGPNGEALSMTSGTLLAADTLMYRDMCTD
ncbi:MAG TPA: hypothetical protein VI456_03820 [Polyangia bacterium]